MEKRKVVSLLIENQLSSLTRVIRLFSRKGYNIKSLTVVETEDENINKMTFTVNSEDHIIDQIKNQLKKLVDVMEITEQEC